MSIEDYWAEIGGEVPTQTVDSLGPEDEAKHTITEWLQEHGADVYWEKSNPFDYPTFKIENERSKPDLLIEIDGVTIAAEMKDASHSKNVYDATLQLHDYWLRYVSHNHQYVADGTPVDIDAFVTGTQYSMKGHLFVPWREQCHNPYGHGNGRSRAIEMGDLPPTEYNMTEQHIRLLWRLAKKAEIDQNTPAIGALLSTALEETAEPHYPAALWTEGKQEGWRCFA